MKKLLNVAAIVLIAGMGCTKQSNINAPISKSNSASATEQIASYSIDDLIPVLPVNPQNPYDSIGARHNQICLLTQEVWDQDSFSLSDPEDIRQLYNAEIEISAFGNNTPPTFEEYQTLINGVISDSSLSFPEFINQSDLSQKAKDYALQLYSKFDAIDQADSFEGYVASFIPIETAIQNDESLGASEKITLLGEASIIRYSSVLWANVLYNDEQNSSAINTPIVSPLGIGSWWRNKVKPFLKEHKQQIINGLKADAEGWKDSGVINNIWVRLGITATASTVGYVTTNKG